MPYVPGFDYDIFVSYASADNDQGIVENFITTLEKQISDNLVHSFSKEKVRLYFDRDRLATRVGVNWESDLKAAASSSAVLVPLLSPNYLSSVYCNNERNWFGTQRHVRQGYPYAVTGWVPIGSNPQPKEFEKAQRHPAGDSWLALATPEERLRSCREFALKLRDLLMQMRASVSAVFLGPAADGRGADTRRRILDELEDSGHRIVPGPDFVYEDPEAVREFLNSSLLAIHFPGDGLDLEGLTAIEESLKLKRKTLLVQPLGSILSDDEATLLAEIDAKLASGQPFYGAPYSRFDGKTDDQIWEVIRREVRSARFQQNKNEFAVGIACEEGDLSGAKALAELITGLGIPAQYPSFDKATSITEKLQALRNIITQSQALICYWAAAAGKGLEKRVAQDARRTYKAKAWYLGPPLDVPNKTSLAPQTNELVLRQAMSTADLATLEPFLRELGWEPQA